MADQTDVDLDSIIDRLLEVRGSRPGKQVQLMESEIRFLCTKAREIFISQPILLELEAPIKVCLMLFDEPGRFFFLFLFHSTCFREAAQRQRHDQLLTSAIQPHSIDLR